MRVAKDLHAAAWIPARLHPFARDVGSFIPEGFAAYARVAHTAEEQDTGTIPVEIVTRLITILRAHTRTPDSCWFAVWEGWGDLRQFGRTTPKLSVPERDLYLLEGPIEDALETLSQIDWSYRSPNLWWPDDKSWCVATEIDFTWTYVGGSSRCIEELLADPAIESAPANLAEPAVG